MKILITGALGHIGSHLISNIYKYDKIKKIFLVDNFESKKYNILFKIKNKKFQFIYGDLTKKNFVMNLPKVNQVIHLASITDVEKSFSETKRIFQNNIGCFNNVVKYCIKNKSKLIHISSTSVYGSPKKIVDEKSILNPQSPYAKIKMREEIILRNSKKLKYITLRFGTISGYSDGMNFHTAINKFCFNAVMKIPIPIWGEALNIKRPYLSLNDAYKVIKHIFRYDMYDNNTYNILSENKTVKEIIELLKKNKLNVKINYINSKLFNQFSYITSKAKIEKTGLKLNSKISTDIKDILKKLIKK